MRYAVFAMIACLMVCLGCGGEKAGDAPGGGVTLTVWETYNNEERAVFLELVEEFHEANPGIKIDAVNIPFDGMEPKILTALATNTAPDIVRVDVGFLPKLAMRGAVHPLDEYASESVTGQLFPVTLASCRIDGHLYGMPDQVNGLCLFYHRELFEEAGLDPDVPPITWEEFVAYAQKLTDEDKGVFGFGMRNSLWWSLPFIYSFGGNILSDDNKACALSEEAAVAGFQFKVDLYSKHRVEGGAWRAGGIRDDVGFQSRKYAMVLNGPWAVKGLQAAGIDFGVALIPAGPAGHATNVGGNNLAVLSTSTHPAEAYRFLAHIVSRDAQARWANELGQIPVNVTANDLIDHSRHPYLGIFMEQMKYARARPPVGSYPEIENDTNPEMQAALDGKKTVQEAMNAACRKIAVILEEEEALKEALR
jgi:ABC-type glycerol-3-phosphate transport system substrate-binding protein